MTRTLVCCLFFFFLMIRRPPRSTLDRSSAASDVYKRQVTDRCGTAVDIIQVFCRIYDGACLNVLAVVVDEDVLHDRQQPGFQVCARDKFINVAYRAKSLSLIHISEPTRPY